MCQCRRSSGCVAGDDDLVAFAGADLVIAARAAVRLLGFVRLDVADVDAVVGFGPAVRAHARVTVPPPGAVTGRGDQPDDERGWWAGVDGLIVERADGVVTLTIDRPERKNAITGDMWRGLVEIFDDIADRGPTIVCS